MKRLTPNKHYYYLLLLLWFCIAIPGAVISQSYTPSSLIDQLVSNEAKSAGIFINLINESEVAERFIIRHRLTHTTSSGLEIKNWFGHSEEFPSRSIYISHTDQSIITRIVTPTSTFDLINSIDSFEWRSSKPIRSLTDGCIIQGAAAKANPSKMGKSIAASDLLEYKIALTASPQFSALHGNTISDVLMSIMGYINQVNTIYERELGITLKLVDDAEKLVFLDGQEDPFSSQADAAVNKNIEILNDSIGSSNYDIGHLLRVGGGGFANIEVVCTSNKGFGVSGLEDATIFHLLLAHEIAHQLGAGHTWNSCSSILNEGQRSPSSAMEPGSGSTLMGYAGLCGTNNVTTVQESYFHAISIDQIRQHTRIGMGSTCPQIMSVPNTPPSISDVTPTEKAIPQSTPFRLSGEALDAEGDMLTHNWDQVDQDAAVNLGIQTLYNPIIRSKLPSISNQRYIPSLIDVANEVEDQAELLPTLPRTLEFRYVVRDNHPGNGNISWVDFQLQTDTSAGPFVINDDAITTWFANGIHPIAWDVANTDNESVDCQLIDILIDYGGSLAFQDTLAHNIPNDGLHYITLPDTVTETARIMVRAADNIFFDLSSEFSIRRTGGQDFQIYSDTTSLDICSESEVHYKLESQAINGFFNPIRYTIGVLPDGVSATLSNNDLSPGFVVDLKITIAENIDRKTYTIPVDAFAANGTAQSINFTLNIIEDDLQAPTLISPNNDNNVDPLSAQFIWDSDHSASKNIIQIANSPKFESSQMIIKDSTSMNQVGIDLPGKGVYFWSVQSENDCSIKVSSPIQSFGVKTTTCNSLTNNNPQSISNGIDSISSIINVGIDAPIQSIFLTNIQGSHSYIGDLTFVLISPDGQRFKLLQNECNESKNFNLGIDNDSDRLRCSINRGLAYKPIDDFSRLNGMSAQGDWTLRIIDNIPGDGGQLDEWELNICSFDNPSNPTLINSDTLKLQPGQEANFNSSILEYRDEDNSAIEIRYIITAEVAKGHLLIGTDTLRLGDSFSQADINNDAIRYLHQNTIEEIDTLSYVVTDGEGYASPIQEQIISIETGVNTITLNDVFGLSIFPNPVKNILHINGLENINSNISAKLYHIDGKLAAQIIIPKSNTSMHWNLSSLPTGIYLINMTTGKAFASEKIIIQR